MAIIVWKKVYETGIVALDKEHKSLIQEVNRLYEAIRDKCSEEVLEDILAMLETYSVDHFQHEEKLMKEYNFPGLDEHVQKHQELYDSVQQLKAQITTGTEDLAKEFLKFLRAWVLDHIVEVDKKYGPFIEARAGRFVT